MQGEAQGQEVLSGSVGHDEGRRDGPHEDDCQDLLGSPVQNVVMAGLLQLRGHPLHAAGGHKLLRLSGERPLSAGCVLT